MQYVFSINTSRSFTHNKKINPKISMELKETPNRNSAQKVT